jgi:hypothetical protein
MIIGIWKCSNVLWAMEKSVSECGREGPYAYNCTGNPAQFWHPMLGSFQNTVDIGVFVMGNGSCGPATYGFANSS